MLETYNEDAFITHALMSGWQGPLLKPLIELAGGFDGLLVSTNYIGVTVLDTMNAVRINNFYI